MAIPAKHGLAEAKAHEIPCSRGRLKQIRRQRRACGWVTQVCGEEPVLVDEDGN
jgi:hypothetical protein